MKQTTIKVKEQELILKQSFRALMQFEEMTGKNAYEINTKVSDSITIFYCMLAAANEQFTLSFNQFLDELDKSPELLAEFNAFMLSLVTPEKAVKKSKKKVETR